MVAQGDRFGAWQVLSEDGRDAHGNRKWRCRCTCGTDRSVLEFSLKAGGSTSCGCTRSVQHGECRSTFETVEHKAWVSMLARCGTSTHAQYANYGGRGISVCDRWHTFENFLADMGRRPGASFSIERRNNDGHYEPGNCVWATKKQQARNRRSNRLLTFRGETAPMCVWAERAGLPYRLVKGRIHKGWSVEAALSLGSIPRAERRRLAGGGHARPS